MGWRARWCSAAIVLAGCGPSSGTPADEGDTTATSMSSSSASSDGATGPGATTVDSTTGTSSSDTTTTDDVTTALDGMAPDFQTCAAVDCSGVIWGCFDGADNDGDGLVDLLDPECTSICDDDEASFQNGLPGDLLGTCRLDCLFDGNDGQGDDGCLVAIECDPESPGANIGCEYAGPPSCGNIPPLADECAPFCEPFVLPGCDCFGCCTIATPDGDVTIWLEGDDECRLDNLAACTSCTSRIDECGNPCDECEICIGQTNPAGGCRTNTCDGGPTCTSPGDCACGEVCHLGCCRPAPSG